MRACPGPRNPGDRRRPRRQPNAAITPIDSKRCRCRAIGRVPKTEHGRGTRRDTVAGDDDFDPSVLEYGVASPLDTFESSGKIVRSEQLGRSTVRRRVFEHARQSLRSRSRLGECHGRRCACAHRHNSGRAPGGRGASGDDRPARKAQFLIGGRKIEGGDHHFGG